MPVKCSLSLHNTNSQSTARVQLRAEQNDSFIIDGLRQGVLPIMVPEAVIVLEFVLIPLACGSLSIPDIRVWDIREYVKEGEQSAEEQLGREIRVVDSRKPEETQGEDLTETNTPVVVHIVA